MNKRTVIISIIICVLGGITAYYFLDTNLIVVITAECAIVFGFVAFIYGMLGTHMKGR